MGLKVVYENKSDIPAGLEEYYQEKDGKFYLQAEGMKTQEDVDRLQESLRKERNDHGDTKNKLKEFDSLGDFEEVRSKLDEHDELKLRADKGEIDDEKIDKIVDARVAREKAPLERELTKLKGDFEEVTTERDGLKDTIVKGQIETAVRKAAEGAKIVPTAIDDVVMMGERLFEVTEDGAVVTKDNVGTTPGIAADVWLTDMQEKRPHWWPESTGGGSKGGKGSTGGFAQNPFSKDHWNMTKQGQIVRENPERAEQMAKAAGTRVGGPKPQ